MEMADINDRTAAAVRICPIVAIVVLKLSAMSISNKLRIVSGGWVANPARSSEGMKSLLSDESSELIA